MPWRFDLFPRWLHPRWDVLGLLPALPGTEPPTFHFHFGQRQSTGDGMPRDAGGRCQLRVKLLHFQMWSHRFRDKVEWFSPYSSGFGCGNRFQINWFNCQSSAGHPLLEMSWLEEHKLPWSTVRLRLKCISQNISKTKTWNEAFIPKALKRPEKGIIECSENNPQPSPKKEQALASMERSSWTSHRWCDLALKGVSSQDTHFDLEMIHP